jgi:hypothetical protein
MKKSIKVEPKKRGRPATGKDPLLTTRAPLETISAIEGWAEKQGITRSEAIRRLVEIGLKAAPALRENVLSTGPTARDLAAAQIDRMVDTDASTEERETRKRRLLKGPQEFRDARVDVEARLWASSSKKRPSPEKKKKGP